MVCPVICARGAYVIIGIRGSAYYRKYPVDISCTVQQVFSMLKILMYIFNAGKKEATVI